MANNAMPNSRMPGKDSTKRMPASSTHCTHVEANDTTGTSAERIRSGA